MIFSQVVDGPAVFVEHGNRQLHEFHVDAEGEILVVLLLQFGLLARFLRKDDEGDKTVIRPKRIKRRIDFYEARTSSFCC